MTFFNPTSAGPAGDSPLVVGHRGSPDRFPDNSLSGILAGLEATGAVEVDVRLSADGHLVLSHDPSLGSVVIAESTWTQLAEVDIGGGHRVCLLDEVLAGGGSIDLEVKNLPGEPGFHTDARLALMVASRARPGDIVTSFYWPDMDRVKRLAPHVETGLLVSAGGSVEDALAQCRGGGHRILALAASLVDDRVCAEANSHGIAVICWTVNDTKQAVELARRGVSAIISDQPQSIEEGFREEGR